MFESYEALKAYLAKQSVEMVDLRYVDFCGRLRHVTLPAGHLTEAEVKDGVGFSLSSVGYPKRENDDMVLVPDLETGLLDPFCGPTTLSFLCDILDPSGREPLSYEPRALVRRADRYLASLGWGDRSLWGPELEFFVLDRVTVDIAGNRSSYRVDSAERIPDGDTQGDGFYLRPMGGYHVMPPTDKDFDLRSDIASQLEALGVPVKYHHHEVGGAGEMEIELPMAGILETADRVMLTKYVAKRVGERWGKSVTFMPKPLYGDAANGMHVHQTIWKGDRNLFSNPEGYAGLSDAALYYTAGLLSHAPAVLAFTNPSTNSFRRLVPGFQAPTNLFFSKGNRSAAVRIPGYAIRPEEKRIEFRPPDATCNVYYALAAQLLAGVDGIAQRLNAEPYGPIDENVHEWSEERRKGLKSLPTTFDQALEHLEKDNAFLTSGGVFPRDLIRSWCRYKIRQEIVPLQERPHPYELAMYFDA